MPNPKTIEERLAWLEDRVTPPKEAGVPVEEPAKETNKMELPWQGISTLKDFKSTHNGRVAIWHSKFDQPYIAHSVKDAIERVTFDDIAFDGLKYTHFLLLTSPEAKTVEAPPVEPERVSVQEFAKNPGGNWFKVGGMVYREFVKEDNHREESVSVRNILADGKPIYATDPTAWLASQAEQEGKSE